MNEENVSFSIFLGCRSSEVIDGIKSEKGEVSMALPLIRSCFVLLFL
jgi:hypothetical protein